MHEVHDLTVEGAVVERELALMKVEGTGDKRVEAFTACRYFPCACRRQHFDSFVFQITGTPEKVDALATNAPAWVELKSPAQVLRSARG